MCLYGQRSNSPYVSCLFEKDQWLGGFTFAHFQTGLVLLGSLVGCPWFMRCPYFFCGTCLCVSIWCQVPWFYSELPWSLNHIELMMVQTHLHETAMFVQTGWSALTPVLEETAFPLTFKIDKVGQWKNTACFPILSSYARSVTVEHSLQWGIFENSGLYCSIKLSLLFVYTLSTFLLFCSV